MLGGAGGALTEGTQGSYFFGGSILGARLGVNFVPGILVFSATRPAPLREWLVAGEGRE